MKRTLWFSLGVALGGGILSLWDEFVRPLHHYEFQDQPGLLLAFLAVGIVCGLGSTLFLLTSFVAQLWSGNQAREQRRIVTFIFGLAYASAVVLWPASGGHPSSLVWIWIILAPLLFGALSTRSSGHKPS